jgi:hypothetical protein
VEPLLEFFRRDLAHGRGPALSVPGDSAAQNQTRDSGNGLGHDLKTLAAAPNSRRARSKRRR